MNNKEKQKMVEIGLKEFQINDSLKDWMKWFVDEIDKVYDKEIDELFECMENPPLIQPKSKKKITVEIKSIKKGKPTPIDLVNY